MVIIDTFSRANEIGFLNTLYLSVNIPNTFSTTTRKPDNVWLKICFGDPDVCFPGYGFIRFVSRANAPSPKKTYEVSLFEPERGDCIGKLRLSELIFCHNDEFLSTLICP